jgi:CubicO group peptidase (beta-lactamase class C family)
MKKNLWLLGILGALAAVAPANLVADQAERIAAFENRLDDLVPALLGRYGVPGASVALVSGGAVVWERGYGLADTATRRPVAPDTLFQVASISKVLTAWGVMRLVEAGKLELDAPVERYLTRWRLPPSAYDPAGVTVRRLLSHSAGLSLHGYPGRDPGTALPAIEASLSGDNGGSGPVALTLPPGAQFSYSGGGYTLLQLMVEEVSGTGFADYLAQTVLEPLGMAASAFEPSPATEAAVATGYDAAGKALPGYIWTEKAAAGLLTSAPDLARWVAAAMPGPDGEPAGRGVLEPATLQTMFAPAIGLTGMDTLMGDGYGLGYALETLPSGARLVGHGGSNRGWQSYFAALPGQGEGIVVLTNSDRGFMMHTELVSAWAAWTGAGPTKLGRLLGAVRAAAAALAVLAAGVLAWRLFGLARRLGAGRPRPPRWWLGALDLGGAALALAAWFGAVGGVVGILMPDLAFWLAAAMIAWALVALAAAVLPRLPAFGRP